MVLRCADITFPFEYRLTRRFVQVRYHVCTLLGSLLNTLDPTGGCHGSKAKSPQIEREKIRTPCEQERRERDAAAQTRNAQARQERPRGQSHEPQAGDRDRPLRSAEKGREGSVETNLAQAVVAQEFVA